MSLMEKIFGDLNEKEVKKVSKIADKVMAYDEEYQKLTDQELRDKTQEFKKRIAGTVKHWTHCCRRPLRYAERAHGGVWA